eukprot:5006972-Amphidinium_carterae.1
MAQRAESTDLRDGNKRQLKREFNSGNLWGQNEKHKTATALSHPGCLQMHPDAGGCGWLQARACGDVIAVTVKEVGGRDLPLIPTTSGKRPIIVWFLGRETYGWIYIFRLVFNF